MSNVTLTIKRVLFFAADSRVGLIFNETKTEDLVFSMPVSWIHRRLKKYVGKKLTEIDLDSLVGSTIEASEFSIKRAGDEYGDQGKTLTKDRIELADDFHLELNEKKARKEILANEKFRKMSDVINKWDDESKSSSKPAIKRVADIEDIDEVFETAPKVKGKQKAAVAEEEIE